jgi:serine/threonine protein kinase, bacterial
MITLLTDILERPLRSGSFLQKRYKIVQFIAKGSYGMAYRAIDHATNHTVLVKQLRKRKRKGNRNWFEHEAIMLQNLNHPSIPKWIDLFEENEISFLVMEFVEGDNFEELIFYQGHRYNEIESFQILLDVLKIVQYIHENRIIHRDLRLPNIIINHGKISVIDFGLAVFCDEKDPVDLTTLPPEKRLYREISYTSDFFALGHFVLFLLYSSYEDSSFKKKSWEEELELIPAARQIIRKLLNIDLAYGHINEIITDVEKLTSRTNNNHSSSL